MCHLVFLTLRGSVMDIEQVKSTLQTIANLNDDKTILLMLDECLSLLGAGDLESDLIDVINAYIGGKELHPQKAAETLAGMIPDVLAYLSWQPQPAQEAIKSNAETLKYLAM